MNICLNIYSRGDEMKRRKHHIDEYFNDILDDLTYLKLKTSFVQINDKK